MTGKLHTTIRTPAANADSIDASFSHDSKTLAADYYNTDISQGVVVSFSCYLSIYGMLPRVT